MMIVPKFLFSSVFEIILCLGVLFSGAEAELITSPLPHTRKIHSDLQPSVCIGYNPETARWGEVGADQYAPEAHCPKGYAYFSVGFPGGIYRPGANISVMGSCCPLPRGVLTDEHVFVLEDCPQDYIATGTKADIGEENKLLLLRTTRTWHVLNHYLRCTKIDTSRFRLASPQDGWIVGWEQEYFSDLKFRLINIDIPRTSRSRIPLGIRYGIARHNLTRWGRVACLGSPWGSLLVGKHSIHCRDFKFSQLQWKPTTENPNPLPVQVFPLCSKIKNPLDIEPECELSAENKPTL